MGRERPLGGISRGTGGRGPGRRLLRAALVATAALGLGACSEQEEAPMDPVAKGAIVYKNVCIACHNADPSQPGALGPAVAGSSRELLLARVVHGRYPEGYVPRQGGGVMPQFPHLEGSIDDLAAYLAQPAQPASE